MFIYQASYTFRVGVYLCVFVYVCVFLFPFISINGERFPNLKRVQGQTLTYSTTMLC